MHALARHPKPGRDLAHRHRVVQHLQHGLIALLHEPELHQHDPDLPRPTTINVISEEGSAPPGADPRV
jgi:hypothetical protein